MSAYGIHACVHNSIMCAIEWQQQRRELGFDRKRFRPVILLCGGKLMYFLRLSLDLEVENCYITRGSSTDDTVVIVLKITSPWKSTSR